MAVSDLPRTLRFILSHPLNRRSRFGGLCRYLRWQVGSRLVGGTPVIDWVDEARLLVAPGEAGLTGNVYCGLLEYPEMPLLLHLLRPDDLFLDVGANLGAYTVLASKVVGARTIAFEPVPSTVAKLRQQIRIHDLGDRVTVLNAGAGSAQGELPFTTDGGPTNKVSLSPDAAGCVRVPVVRLDDVVPPHHRVYAKMDVEGYEYEVQRGAARLLESTDLRGLIVDLNDAVRQYGHSNEDVHALITAAGFKPITYEPYSRTITLLPGFTPGNTIYVRDPDEARNLVRAAPRRVIHTAAGAVL
jgi:FkbM family methyltransferase